MTHNHFRWVGLGLEFRVLGENIQISNENDIELCAHISCHYGCYVSCVFRSISLSLGLKFSAHISFGSSKFFSSDSLRYFLKFTFFAIGIEIAIDFIPKYLIDLLRRNTLICSFGYKQKQNARFLPSLTPLPPPQFHIVCLFVSYFHFSCSIDRCCSREGKEKQKITESIRGLLIES